MPLPSEVTRSLPGVARVAREPIVAVNLISALVLEVVILLRQFGVPLTDGQVDAINAVAGLVLLIAATLFGRKLTTPLADPRDELGLPLTPEPPAGSAASEIVDNVRAPESPVDTQIGTPPLPPTADNAREALPTPPVSPPIDPSAGPSTTPPAGLSGPLPSDNPQERRRPRFW